MKKKRNAISIKRERGGYILYIGKKRTHAGEFVSVRDVRKFWNEFRTWVVAGWYYDKDGSLCKSGK